MKLDRLLDQGAYLASGWSRSNHSRQVGHVSRPSRSRFFINNYVVHASNPACLKTLFRVPGGRIIIWVPRQRHASGLRRVFVLAMTATGLLQEPAIPLQQLDDISYFHEENSYLG